MLIIAAVSNDHAAIDWARDWASSSFGELLLESERFAFVETDYYEATMGEGLMKAFFAFRDWIRPDELAAIKRMTNEVEALCARQSNSPQQRPLNLDPGYLTESKLVLASTKDHAHRIYLREGIFAEVTLRYRHRQWQPWEWTYPDYRREDYQAFFSQCRDALRARD
jgi:hypothetical protein